MTNDNTQGQITGYRLSPQQEALWLQRPEQASYRVQCAMLFPHSAAPDELRAALESVVARHEALRTTFAHQPGLRLPVQVVHDELAPGWSVESLDGSIDERETVEALLASEAAKPLDLERGPVLQALAVSAGDRTALVLTAASVCADTASLGVVARELSELLTDGHELGEPFQYADFAEWRNELLANDDDEAHAARAFWAGQGATHAPSPRLLFGTSASSDDDFTPAHIAIALEPGTQEALAAVASAYGTDPTLVVEAAWHALVSRLSGESETVVPTLVDGRAHDELHGAVGSFAAFLPVGSRIDDATSFAEVLDQVRRGRAEAEQWQDYRSGDDMHAVSEQLRIRFSGRSLLEAPAGAHVLAVSGAMDRFALDLRATTAESTLTLELAYDPAAYSEDDARRIAASLVTLLEQAIEEPAATVSSLPLLDETELQRIVSAWNQTSTDIPTTSVHLMVEQQAARTPERDAVEAGPTKLSYAELNMRANQVADDLRAAGVNRGSTVGLCMDRSADMVVGLLGILKAGGAYVPLNFEHPQARLTHQLAESGAVALVTLESLGAELPFEGHVLCMDRDRDRLASRSAENLEPVNEPDDLVYVMYTSGSTGMPKGVGVTHRNLVNYTTFVIERLDAAGGEGLRFGAVSAISTDLGNTCVFPSIASGGCLHLVGPEVAMDGALFADEVARTPLDVLKITPSHLGALLTGAGDRPVLPRKWLVIGGEALPPDLVDRVRGAGDVRILNHYGPTETTVGSCTFEVGAGVSERRTATVPIGKPIANSTAYVLDGNLKQLPIGVPGELCIGGAGVATGYVNQPEQTAEAFVPDPFAAEPGARLYRTGDRARLLPDGNIEFLGRVDFQVKIRGYRVEPSEVELALARHPSIKQAAVVAHEDGQGDARLIAYLVASAEVKPQDLQAFLRTDLPDFMVPSAFVVMEALPFTASGKIDRQSLPDPATAEMQREVEYVAPRTPLEEALADIWAEVLGVERVGVNDDFFALGGHSLMATQVIARIRSEYAEIPLHSIFTSPTVESLADVVLQASLADASEEDLRAIDAGNGDAPA